jgi:hypothetical protein
MRLALLCVFLALPVAAAEPEVRLVEVQAESLIGQVAVNGHSEVSFGARLTVRHTLPLGIKAFARTYAWTQGDSRAAAVKLDDWSTFRTIEFLYGAHRKLLPWLAAIVAAGVTIPVESGRPAELTEYPRTLFAGALLGDERLSHLAIGAGEYQPAGNGLRIIASTRLRIDAKTALFAEAALGLARDAAGQLPRVLRVGLSAGVF